MKETYIDFDVPMVRMMDNMLDFTKQQFNLLQAVRRAEKEKKDLMILKSRRCGKTMAQVTNLEELKRITAYYEKLKPFPGLKGRPLAGWGIKYVDILEQLPEEGKIVSVANLEKETGKGICHKGKIYSGIKNVSHWRY